MKYCQIYEVCDKNLVQVPLVNNKVAAGFPSPAAGYEEESLNINDLLITNAPATFYIRVTGNSMIDANINEGDILVVDKSIEPAHGQVVIAIVNGDFTVKTLYMKDGDIKLLPANPDYPEILLSGEDQLNIWGVVSYAIKKFKL